MAKAAVLICQGCDIASSLDLAALEKVAAKCEGVIRARSVPFLCDEAGAKSIDETLALGANALVIAACATRFHTRAFVRPGCHTERISLRELVVYSHEPKHEDTQMLAEDMVRMGAARAAKVELAEPQRHLAAEGQHPPQQVLIKNRHRNIGPQRIELPSHFRIVIQCQRVCQLRAQQDPRFARQVAGNAGVSTQTEVLHQVRRDTGASGNHELFATGGGRSGKQVALRSSGENRRLAGAE